MKYVHQKDFKALAHANLVLSQNQRFVLFLYQLFIDVPVYVSYPHFMDADPSLSEPFEGLNPIREKHQTYLKLQPVIKASKLQIIAKQIYNYSLTLFYQM